jgi:hypothetical protein
MTSVPRNLTRAEPFTCNSPQSRNTVNTQTIPERKGKKAGEHDRTCGMTPVSTESARNCSRRCGCPERCRRGWSASPLPITLPSLPWTNQQRLDSRQKSRKWGEQREREADVLRLGGASSNLRPRNDSVLVMGRMELSCELWAGAWPPPPRSGNSARVFSAGYGRVRTIRLKTARQTLLAKLGPVRLRQTWPEMYSRPRLIPSPTIVYRFLEPIAVRSSLFIFFLLIFLLSFSILSTVVMNKMISI